MPSYLKHVARLPCEISVFKKIAILKKLIKANSHVRRSHSKTVLKYSPGKIYITHCQSGKKDKKMSTTAIYKVP